MEQQRNKRLRDQLKEINKDGNHYMIKKQNHSEEEELIPHSSSCTDNPISNPQLNTGD